MIPISKDSIIVGVDVHKYTHQAVALNCLGQELSQCAFSNDELNKCLDWLSHLGEKQQIIIGLEDVTGSGIHLTQRLQKAQFNVRFVPSILTERKRKHSVHKDKNDYLDAMRVGKVILTAGEETLPATIIVSQERKTARILDLFLQERRELVREQTGLKNQLHSLLHQYFGNKYRQQFKDIFSHKALCWYTGQLSRDALQETGEEDGKEVILGSIQRRIKRLQVVQEQIKDIKTGMNKYAQNQQVQALQKQISGCGELTACKIIAEIGTIRRFSNKSQLAKYAGIAPIEKGSAKKSRYYTNPYGNRKLNQAIHTIALSQIGLVGFAEAKIYYQKKLNEGKSKLWAIRCLKRHISNKVFAVLQKEEENILRENSGKN